MRPSRLAALAALLLVAPTAQSAEPLFQAGHLAYPSNGPSRAAVIADFDGDGIPDVVLDGALAPKIQPFKGSGDGTLILVPSLPLANVGSLAAGDLNDDDRVDLVTTRDGITTVLLGNGDLTFAPPLLYGTSETNAGEHVVLADLTGDGVPDVIATDSTLAVHVWPGVGDGTLGTPTPLPVPQTITSVATGDFDDNGHLDVVVSVGGADFCVFLNAGGGVFAAPLSSPGSGWDGPAAGHIDGDGVLDLVVDTRWLRGNGDGTFAAPVEFGDAMGGVGSAIADVNGDGFNDVLTLSIEFAGGSFLSLFAAYLGDGAGNFAAPLYARTSSSAQSLVAGDLDDDGDVDVVVPAHTFLQFALHPGNGDGTFGTSRDHATPGVPVAALIAEVTGDDQADVLALCQSSATVRVFPGLGDGDLGAPVDLATPANPRRLAAGDVNGDGHTDLVTANGSSNSISVFPGLPGGGFDARTDHATGTTTIDVVVSDLDGDLIGDVVSLGSSGIVSVFPGQPGGPLGARDDYGGGFTPQLRLFVGHVDDDMVPDVAVFARSASFFWQCFPGVAGGALGTPTQVQTGFSQSEAYGVAGDINADGFLDLLVINEFGLGVQIGSSGGTFTDLPFQGFPEILRRSRALAPGDLDGDGHSDLFTGNWATGTGAAHLGDGTGAFMLEHGYGSGGLPWDVALGDLDGNGRLDVVLANDATSTITVLLDHSAPTASVKPSGPTNGGPAFTRVWPVPGAGAALHAAFHLRARGEAVLELVDLTGRRVGAKRLGVLDPGERQAKFEVPAGARPGVYWLRLTQAGSAASARVVIVQ